MTFLLLIIINIDIQSISNHCLVRLNSLPIFVVRNESLLYSMNLSIENKLNRLLQAAGQPGRLFFSAWLKRNGYSDQLLQQYRMSGWLESLSKGVMYRAGDKLNSFGALSSYNDQMGKEFYIGAHSALELSGFSHFVPMGKPLLMVGHPKDEPVPDWLKESDFDFELHFFSTNTFKAPLFYQHKEREFQIPVSVPEQAFLECLLLAPSRYSYMDLYYLMEQLTTLRPEVLQSILENTTNLKVKRMFLYMAGKAGHYWFKNLDRSKIHLGSSKYQLAKNGIYIPEYRITVPKELYDYE